ncbi:MAG: ergothioneine biosynthesis protein EgtB, partial [Flavobacteriales bacterium]
QQHQELLITDTKYIFACDPLLPKFDSSLPDINEAFNGTSMEEPNFISFDEGVYEIGYEGEDFHYDNEEGRHKKYLHDFKMMNRPVTNGEFIEFINDGGYENPVLWMDDGWGWINENQIKTPLYWQMKDGEHYQFTLNGMQKVNPNAPVTHLSFYEADAFARWKGMRMPTEEEWEVATAELEHETSGNSNFMDTGNLAPVPGAGKHFLGNVWEWTESAYRPYPFYKAEEGALGEYNGKFMINQMVLRGGSCATPRDHIRRTYRNFFHPEMRWQFNGIRLAYYT